MKNLLGIPSSQAGPIKLADALELFALRSPRKRASQSDLIAGLDRKEDEDEERFERPVLEAFEELDLRKKHLGAYSKYYPFRLERTSVISKRRFTDQHYLYLFLLLCTNLNMSNDRVHAGLDGAFLFEHLCCEIAKRFFGSTSGKEGDKRVNAVVFGTSRSKLDSWDVDTIETDSFEEAVNNLCDELGEGGYFRKKNDYDSVNAKDDRVDLVVWRGFSDERYGRLIGFGQCKTGTHWKHELPRLKPQAFSNKWLHNPLSTPSLALFFVSDRVKGNLFNEASDGGIILDRCRVLDYAQAVPKGLLARCTKWTKAVLKKHGLD